VGGFLFIKEEIERTGKYKIQDVTPCFTSFEGIRIVTPAQAVKMIGGQTNN